MFREGDIVLLRDIENGAHSVSSYYSEAILPAEHRGLIIHGQTTINRDYYNQNGAVVVKVITERDGRFPINIVRYKGGNDRFVQLGFKDDALTLKIREWRRRFE